MENNSIVAELRNTLQQNLKHTKELVTEQQKTFILFQRILKRFTVLFILFAVCIVVGIFTLSNFINSRVATNTQALKNINELNHNVLLQRRFNQIDREDIANARKDIAPALHIIDSTKKRQDSIWKKKIKRQMVK